MAMIFSANSEFLWSLHMMRTPIRQWSSLVEINTSCWMRSCFVIPCAMGTYDHVRECVWFFSTNLALSSDLQARSMKPICPIAHKVGSSKLLRLHYELLMISIVQNGPPPAHHCLPVQYPFLSSAGSLVSLGLVIGYTLQNTKSSMDRSPLHLFSDRLPSL